MLTLALMLAVAQATPADPVDTYAQCLVIQAKALDDGKSDASTVALIVRQECRELERVAALALSGPNDFENRNIVVAQIEAGGLGRAVRAVLRVRSGGR